MQTTSEIKSALNENLSLHATYYFKEIYVTENQLVKEGENILQNNKMIFIKLFLHSFLYLLLKLIYLIAMI